MREILFRGKWLGNGEWVEGYYCKISETTYAFAEDYERNPIPVHHYILQETMTDWGLPNRFNQYEIDPETLCQYTGLHDKNGNRIWENDIVLCESGEACMGYREFRKTILVDSISNWQTMQILSECEDLKRLGNVFDNPELLGGAV